MEATPEKRRFVGDHREQLGSVSEACRAVGLAVSSYYYKAKDDPEVKAQTDADLRDKIEAIQAELPFYGHRRVHEHLEQKFGLTVNKKKLLRIMRKYGLRALIWSGFKVKTTDSNHDHGYAPNLLPGMVVDHPNQVWVADITYIRILTGFVYLAAILDLFSRKIVGWAISRRIDRELCLAALDQAVRTRRPAPGCIHHSDRGVQYACGEYVQFLKDNELVPSMSAKGYCYDNAFMESFFKTLKAEEVYLTEYRSYEDVLDAVPQFIDAVYNQKRMHSGIGYLAPNEFERLWTKGVLQRRGINPALSIPAGPSS
jgi:transposase InsO family protein